MSDDPRLTDLQQLSAKIDALIASHQDIRISLAETKGQDLPGRVKSLESRMNAITIKVIGLPTAISTAMLGIWMWFKATGKH